MLKPLITCTQRVYTDTRIGMVLGFFFGKGVGIFNIAMRSDGPYGKQIVSNHKMGGQENSIQLIVPLHTSICIIWYRKDFYIYY